MKKVITFLTVLMFVLSFNAQAQTAPKPTFNHPGGLITEPIELVISCTDPDAIILINWDEDYDPDEESEWYEEPLEIDFTTEIRARAAYYDEEEDDYYGWGETAKISFIYPEEVETAEDYKCYFDIDYQNDMVKFLGNLTFTAKNGNDYYFADNTSGLIIRDTKGYVPTTLKAGDVINANWIGHAAMEDEGNHTIAIVDTEITVKTSGSGTVEPVEVNGEDLDNEYWFIYQDRYVKITNLEATESMTFSGTSSKASFIHNYDESEYSIDVVNKFGVLNNKVTAGTTYEAAGFVYDNFGGYEIYPFNSKDFKESGVEPVDDHYTMIDDYTLLTEKDTYLIVDLTSSRAMTSSKGTSATPTAVSVEIEDNVIAAEGVTEDLNWNVKVLDNGYMFTKAGDNTKWLYCINDNKGLRVGTGAAKVFELGITSGNYVGMKNIDQGRYVGVFSNTDWRSYTSINDNIKNTKLAFFVLGDAPISTKVATPVITPATGAYDEEQTVTITCATEGADIYYTLDGSTPTTDSDLYEEEFYVEATTTVKAIAVKEGMENSSVATSEITILEVIDIFDAREMAMGTTVIVEGLVNMIDGKTIYMEDGTAGIAFYCNAGAPAGIALGDEVHVKGTLKNYNGFIELDGVVATDSTSFQILSKGNELDYQEVTVEELLDDYSEDNNYQSCRVLILNAELGKINTTGNTVLTQYESNINIYKIPAGDYAEGDHVNIYAVPGAFNNIQLRVAQASDIEKISFAVTPTTLNKFTYEDGDGPSTTQTITITSSGVGEISIATYDEEFEISTDDESYSDEIILDEEFVGTQTVYVRLADGLEVSEYNSTLVVQADGFDDVEIELNGEVVEPSEDPYIVVDPEELEEFVYTEGEVCESQTVNIEGGNLTVANITISTTGEFEFMLADTKEGYVTSKTISIIAGEIDVDILVRMKSGLAVDTYEGQLVIEAEETTTIDLVGTVEQAVEQKDWHRIVSASELSDGDRVVIASRYDENVSKYYAMTASTSGKPAGVAFEANGNLLPQEMVDNVEAYAWTISIDGDNFTFTNAEGKVLGYTSSTNFATGGENTAWTVVYGKSAETTRVPDYFGYQILNVNKNTRSIALNTSNNFGPYSTDNIASADYNFFLDIFMEGEGKTPQVATPTFNYGSGIYFEDLQLEILCGTAEAEIYYTLDGTIPDETSEVYTTPLTISETTTVTAVAMKEGFIQSDVAIVNLFIDHSVTVIFNQDFENDWNGWSHDINLGDGSAEWTISSYAGNKYAYANGNDKGSNQMYLISPVFNLNEHIGREVLLSFRTAQNNSEEGFRVLFSNDYDGANVEDATWEELDCTLSSGNAWTWVESGDIDLTQFSGDACYIAFEYTNTEDVVPVWEVDDIILKAVENDNPYIKIDAALQEFSYIQGQGPSEMQLYTIIYKNIPDGTFATISTESTAFELSTDGFEFNNTVTFVATSGMQEENIFVRMKEGLTPGNYSAEISNGMMSFVYTVNVEGVVKENEGIDELSLNAANIWNTSSEIVVECGATDNYTMIVNNIAGQPVLQVEGLNGNSRVSHNLKSGAYIVRILNNNGVKAQTIIVR